MFQSQAESEAVQPNHSNSMPNSISEEPINRLPNNLGRSAHQSQLFYTRNSSPEEPIHRLPSNLRGSSHQSDQFFEPENEIEEVEEEAESEGVQPNVSPSSQSNSSSEESINQLHGEPEIEIEEEEEAAESEGVQPHVSPSSQLNPNRTRSRFNQLPSESESESEPEILGGGDPPNVNPGGSAHQQQLTEAQIKANYEFGTAEHLRYYRSLHNAAKRGDWKSAKSFIEMDPNALTAMITVDSKTVFHVAALCDQWEFIVKLLELVLSPESIAVQDVFGKTVLHYVAQGGSLKTAKALVQKNNDLPRIGDNERDPPLHYSIWSENKELVWYLSSMTSVDLSPDWSPWILRTLILSGYHDVALHFVKRYSNLALAKDVFGDSLLYWLAIAAPSVNMVRDAKLKHKCAVELVNYVCIQLSNMSFQEIEHFLQQPNSILDRAIKCGIEEIVRTLLLQFPDLLYVRVLPNRNILQAAIEYRQENIVNVIKEISTSTAKGLGSHFIESQGITLHLAGKLAPACKLFSVSGAALQMQRELQWFKEVEEITFTYRREWKNLEGETPKDVFRTAHIKLAEEGEKWMKDTANSCMLVSTLIATVLFAAAFTVPGGHSDKGIAIFLHTKAFIVFAISDALGLFFSLNSLLMFLAILTARYELDDFLESLPKKLIIGLGSLLIAIATMIIAFVASLSIVLSQRWIWVFVPITLVASFPVAIFVRLQLPLFVQMVRSTYGASIFRPWPTKKFE
ncbi:hypothetical protein LWI28_005919 [Acer negundo]|uniref:PGG domain-containing protein n=1 Tax=Acer negundo TaxID=4023 RepID=A0AAD5IC94_ACENE|nr:hypothetical protein LWI28_005919 [Acer negundo]